jgi:hypothetical protein
MHFGYDVCSVNDNGCSLGGTESYVKDGSIFCDIDFVPAEHGFDPVSKAGFLCQLDEELERLVRNPILRVIQEQSCGFRCHALAALGVLCKKLPEMQLFDFGVVSLESFPRFTLGQRLNAHSFGDWC